MLVKYNFVHDHGESYRCLNCDIVTEDLRIRHTDPPSSFVCNKCNEEGYVRWDKKRKKMENDCFVCGHPSDDKKYKCHECYVKGLRSKEDFLESLETNPTPAKESLETRLEYLQSIGRVSLNVSWVDKNKWAAMIDLYTSTTGVELEVKTPFKFLTPLEAIEDLIEKIESIKQSPAFLEDKS